MSTFRSLTFLIFKQQRTTCHKKKTFSNTNVKRRYKECSLQANTIIANEGFPLLWNKRGRSEILAESRVTLRNQVVKQAMASFIFFSASHFQRFHFLVVFWLVAVLDS